MRAAYFAASLYPKDCSFLGGFGPKASGHGIESAFTQRMTPEDPAQGKIHPLQGSVLFDRLDSVIGAGGQKTASRRKKRRHYYLVELYYKDEQSTHQELRFSEAALKAVRSVRDVGAGAREVVRLLRDLYSF